VISRNVSGPFNQRVSVNIGCCGVLMVLEFSSVQCVFDNVS